MCEVNQYRGDPFTNLAIDNELHTHMHTTVIMVATQCIILLITDMESELRNSQLFTVIFNWTHTYVTLHLPGT